MRIDKAEDPPAKKIAPTSAAVASDFPPVGGSDLPPIGGGGGGFPPVGAGPRGFGTGLGSLGGRAGRFEFDPEAKKRAAEELAKMNADFDAAFDEEEKKEEGMSL